MSRDSIAEKATNEKEFLDKLALYQGLFEDFAHEVPNDVGRNLSCVREVNQQQHKLINELNLLKEELHKNDLNENGAMDMLSKAEIILLQFLQLNEEKMEYTQTITNMLQEVKIDLDYKFQQTSRAAENISDKIQINVSAAKTDDNTGGGGECSQPSTSTKRTKKKRKGKKSDDKQQKNKSSNENLNNDDSDTEIRYCFCKQLSFGEMVLCDNEQCTIQWFHFECVDLTTKPRGRWYCPNCRGIRSNRKKKQ